MLVLSRQVGQTVVIGSEVEVTVVDIRGDKVRLGFTAPKEIRVDRKEIYEQIQREKQQAAAAAGAVADPFMRAAFDEAHAGLKEGGLPIGSVLVRDGQIIAAGHNRRVQNGDPMAHAEIDCLTRAGRQKSYADTILYSTLIPCFLCSGAVIQFGIPKVVVGDTANFPGAPQLLRAKGIDLLDLHDAPCIEMMGAFIREHPDLWNEDIGK
jgi:cytosine/creatinine deaminase